MKFKQLFKPGQKIEVHGIEDNQLHFVSDAFVCAEFQFRTNQYIVLKLENCMEVLDNEETLSIDLDDGAIRTLLVQSHDPQSLGIECDGRLLTDATFWLK